MDVDYGDILYVGIKLPLWTSQGKTSRYCTSDLNWSSEI